jgi:hypothetical protein
MVRNVKKSILVPTNLLLVTSMPNAPRLYLANISVFAMLVIRVMAKPVRKSICVYNVLVTRKPLVPKLALLHILVLVLKVIPVMARNVSPSITV